MVKKTIGTFYKKKLKKPNQEEFRIGNVIEKKGDKLYVKWKGYYNSCNSWIDKKDIVSWTYKKRVNIFVDHVKHLEETLMSKLIFLIMQQKLV